MSDIYVTLVCQDGNKIQVSYDAILQSETLSDLCSEVDIYDALLNHKKLSEMAKLDKSGNGNSIIIPNIDEHNIPIKCDDIDVLSYVIQYMEHYKDRPAEKFNSKIKSLSPPEMDAYEVNYIKFSHINKKSEQETKLSRNSMLIECLILAEYLKINKLANILAYAASLIIKNKTPKEIREELGIENDLSSEDLKQIEQEELWLQ